MKSNSSLYSLIIFLCALSIAHASKLEQVAYLTDDLHLPYPLLFTHGYNSDAGTWRDGNPTTQFLFNNMAGRYGYDGIQIGEDGKDRLAWALLNEYNGYGRSLEPVSMNEVHWAGAGLDIRCSCAMHQASPRRGRSGQESFDLENQHRRGQCADVSLQLEKLARLKRKV